MRLWLGLATSKGVVHRAARTAVLVGAILIAINYGDAILTSSVRVSDFAKMGLTLLVPYMVSTFSSVAAIREHTDI